MNRRAPIAPSPDAALLKLVDGYVAANKKWRAISAAGSRAEKGLPMPAREALQAMERKSTAALSVVDSFLYKVERKRAFTLAGIVAKARVAAIEGADDENFAATLGVSMARDLLALDGVNAAAARKRRKVA